MSETEFVIQTKGLGKSYDGVHALKNLDLHVPDKAIFAFLGPNGAGKTTTIKLLLGLVKPTSGSGIVMGKDIVRESVAIRADIGYLPQDFRFYEHMSPRQTLDYTLKFFFKGPQTELNRRIDEMLELVGLTDLADRPIKGFSGGERQRLGIAQADVNHPDLLILDEPAASLDPMGRRDVLEVMKRIRKYASVFYCTHILDDVQRVSDQVAILNRGELVTQAPIEELLESAGGPVYTVKLRGEGEDTYSQISALPWVTEVEVSQEDGQTIWDISVTDASAAEDQLMSLIVTSGAKVADFGRKSVDLEDIFLNIIEGEEK
ncbi:MAG: ABC transporter ATP-binding protein [Candidatus Thorarchaeota archaeon]|jgi:ABC-2 type transport system ATP-binding protein